MAYGTLPWPAVSGSPSYSADQWKNMMKTTPGVGGRLANAGILPASNGMLRVYASNPATMVVHVEPGFALINGLFAYSDAVVDQTIDNADPTYYRYDRIVFRSNSTTKAAAITYRKGTAGASPVPPALVQDGAPYYDIPLAQIEVKPAATTLSQPSLWPEFIIANASPGDIQMCRATGTIVYGSIVGWDAPEYPTVDSLDGYYFNRVCFRDGTNYTHPLAGVALAGATTGQLVPVLTRGFWIGDTETVQEINPYDLISAAYFEAGVSGGRMTKGTHPALGIALQWLRTTGSDHARLAVFIDPLAYLNTPIYGVTGAVLGTNSTTTSTSWVDIDNFGASQVYTRARYVEYEFMGCISNSAAANRTKFTLNIDGTDLPAPLWDQASPVAAYRQMVHFSGRIDMASFPPINAIHTIKPRWCVTAGTSTFYNVSGEVQGMLWIKEVL